MTAASLAFLAVPVVTGLASALWSPIMHLSWTGTAALYAATYVAIWLALAALRPADPGLTEVVRALGWWPVLGYVGLTVAVAMMWFLAHRETHVVWIAVGEMAWPACVLVGTLILARWTSLPVAAPPFKLQHALWTGLILAGVVGLAVTEARRG